MAYILLLCISIFIMLTAIFILLTSLIGLFKMKDLYSRFHTAGLLDVLVLPLFVVMLIMFSLYQGNWVLGGKLFLIILLALPTSAYITYLITEICFFYSDVRKKADLKKIDVKSKGYIIYDD